MTYLSITALINSIFSSAFGFTLLTLEKDHGSRVAINAFSAMCLAVAWWSGAYYFWQIANNSISALFFIRLSEVGSILIAVFFVHFAIYLQGRPTKLAIIFLYLCYLISIVFELLTYTKTHITGLRPVWFFEYWPIPGPTYTIRMFFWILFVIYGAVLLLRMLPKQQGDGKKSVVMINMGVIIGFIGGSTNYLPWYGIEWLPWGNGFVIAYIGLIGYAILRYQALNIKTTAIRLVAFLVTATALIELFSARNIEDLIVRLALAVSIIILSQTVIIKTEQEAKHKVQQHLKLVSQHQELRKIHQANMAFISDIAHRLKTPLAIIQFKTDPSQPSDATTQAEVNEVAKTTVATLRNIVQTGKIDAELVKPDRQPLDLAFWLHELTPDLIALAPNHTIHVNLPPTPLTARVDRLLLREALYNLVDNARKFSPVGSTIKISARVVHPQIELCINDHGLGISQKDLAHIFERHYQANGTRQQFAGSAGLGLSLVKWVAEAHGGHVEVSSSPENGTTFSLFFPTAKPPVTPHHKTIKQLTSET